MARTDREPGAIRVKPFQYCSISACQDPVTRLPSEKQGVNLEKFAPDDVYCNEFIGKFDTMQDSKLLHSFGRQKNSE